MERAPTVSEMIDQSPLSRYQIWTMALCAMVVVLDGPSGGPLGAIHG